MIEHASMALNAMGGTELMARRLSNVKPELLDKCQIWLSRYDPDHVDPTKYQILYTHDLAQDPASLILQAGGHARFHAIVFVSYWQKQQFQTYYDIPPSKCYVLRNAIEPFPVAPQREERNTIRLGYWSTPHRGLEILVPVFEQLAKEFDNIELDVFSSFDLYGWPERDAPYQVLFERCRNHPKINYHGSVDNATIREYAINADILAYPCIWQETSCLVLIEALAAGMTCVHPDLAALPETASDMTVMYRYDEDPMKHAETFYQVLRRVIQVTIDRGFSRGSRAAQQENYIGNYSWAFRQAQWENALREITSADL